MKKNDKDFILKWSKRIRAIDLLGGKCSSCGNKEIMCLEFHHEGNKIDGIHELILHRWSDIEKEIKKCILLCCNCHSEIHNSGNSKTTAKKLKIKFLEFKGILNCQKCGYGDKNNDGLDFHHRESETKVFSIGNAYKFLTKFRYKIEEELLKCDVLCGNCHSKAHFNHERFLKFKDKIYEKIKSYKESKRVDVEMVKKLNMSGHTNIEICKELGLSSSTVCMAISAMGLKCHKKERIEKIKECRKCNRLFICIGQTNIDGKNICSDCSLQMRKFKINISKENLERFLLNDTFSSVARKFNTSPNTIIALAKKYGLK